jgi:hypothetical protein
MQGMAKASCLVSIVVLVMAVGSVCGAEEPKIDGKHTCIMLRALDRADSEYATTLSTHGNAAESMIPLLQSIAKTDPVLSLRDYTALAITRMRKRLEARAFDFARNDQ